MACKKIECFAEAGFLAETTKSIVFHFQVIHFQGLNFAEQGTKQGFLGAGNDFFNAVLTKKAKNLRRKIRLSALSHNIFEPKIDSSNPYPAKADCDVYDSEIRPFF